jgi:hypothetical protein
MQVRGSCHCGNISFEATVAPERTTICHCIDCQKLTGTAFRVSVPAEEGSFRILAGQPSVYVRIGDSGARRAQAFCPNCGTPLYVYDADNPKVYGLRVGSLEERSLLVPQTQKWCRSALAWTNNLPNMENREKG